MTAEPWTSVIAIDPGERVGYAVGRMRTNELEVIEHGVLALKPFALWLAEAQNVCDIDGSPGYGKSGDVLVYETWRARPKNGSMEWIRGNDMQPSQVIGMIRQTAWLSGAKLAHLEPRDKMVAQATMAQWVTDLKKGSNEEHSKDALDLLWQYYWKLYFDPSEVPNG